MSDFSIRLARPEDAEHLPAIERAAGQLFAEIDGLAAIAEMDPITAREHRSLIRKGRCLVAETGGRLAGFLSAVPEGRELAIRELSVHPDCQRAGIGAVLLRAAAIDAHNSGLTALTLTTFADVPWNGPFYERRGFVTVTDLAAHPRLKAQIDEDAANGLPRANRVAMIKFLP